MNISWHGLSCFSISSKTQYGEVKVVVDPYDNKTGLRFPRTMEADLVLSSHQADHASNVKAVGGKPFVIDSPGEYEVKGVFAYGVQAPLKEAKEGAKEQSCVIFRIVVEDVIIAHLGPLNRELTDDELKDLQNVDILMIPVGGGNVMSPKEAVKVISQIDPRIILPMTHAIPNLKDKYAKVDDFCKELGVCQREDVNKLKVTRNSLPDEETIVTVLSRA